MKGGSAIYCPTCNNRQNVGDPGRTLELPLTVRCGKCGASLTLEKSRSGGIHVTAAGTAAG
jgi:hypothetical protein